MQANPYGRVLYTHAGGIDHPMDLIRMGINGLQSPLVVVPHAEGMGRYDFDQGFDRMFDRFLISPNCDAFEVLVRMRKPDE